MRSQIGTKLVFSLHTNIHTTSAYCYCRYMYPLADSLKTTKNGLKIIFRKHRNV